LPPLIAFRAADYSTRWIISDAFEFACVPPTTLAKPTAAALE
jgi:hypothetical protein